MSGGAAAKGAGARRGRAIIPFAQDPAGRLMPWLIGFMTFVAGLALAGALLLNDFAESWSEGLADSMTVQIPPPADEMGDATAADQMAVSSQFMDHTRASVRLVRRSER